MSSASQEPQIVVIVGPNGAGKSTISRNIVATLDLYDFLNADDVARGISPLHPESAALEAARVVLLRFDDLASQRRDFAVESTLSGRTYFPRIRMLCGSGYVFRLLFVTLHSAEVSVARVRSRVAAGGHNVPEADIRRRFDKAMRNFFSLYMPLADSWACMTTRRPIRNRYSWRPAGAASCILC